MAESALTQALRDARNFAGNALLKHNKGQPSVVTNVLTGKNWNQDLPRFGGPTTPQPDAYSFKPKISSNIVSPLPTGQAKITPMPKASPTPTISPTITPTRAPVAPRQVLQQKTPITPTPTVSAMTQAQNAVGRIRQAGQGKGMSDQQIMDAYAKYGNKIVAGLPTPTPTPQLNPLESKTIPVFEQYKIHPAVAFGIAGAEGGKIGNHNIWNINAVDSNPNAAYNYGSHEDAATGAAKLMAQMIQSQGVSNTDPKTQLLAIEKAGYAGDPRTWKQRSIQQGGAGKYFNHWSDFVMSTPAWQKWTAQR